LLTFTYWLLLLLLLLLLIFACLQDDDAIVRPQGMKDLLAARAAGAPGQLVGFRGRTWNRQQEPQ
jgi:hypothetical protein